MKTIAESLSKQRGIGRYGESRLVVEAVEYNIAYFEATGRWFHEVYPANQDESNALASEGDDSEKEQKKRAALIEQMRAEAQARAPKNGGAVPHAPPAKAPRK